METITLCEKRTDCIAFYENNCALYHPEEDYISAAEILITIPCPKNQNCEKYKNGKCSFLHDEDLLKDQINSERRQKKLSTLKEDSEQILTYLRDLDHSYQIDFDQEFEILDEDPLGQGSTGIVYKVKQISTGKVFACKEMAKVVGVEAISQRIAELNFMRRLNNPNLLNFIGFDYKRERKLTYTFYFIMPLAQNDMSNFLKANPNYFTNNIETFVEFCNKMISAIYYLHMKSVIHRDIKPQNILCFSNDDANADTYFKFCDYGFSKIYSGSTISKVVGSEEFICPELASLNLNEPSQITKLDLYKSDSYSLGLILLFALGLNIKSNDWQEKLKEKCSKKYANIPTIITQLLVVNPNERKSVLEVFPLISKKILIKIELNKEKTDCFMTSSNFSSKMLENSEEYLNNLLTVEKLYIDFSRGNNDLDEASISYLGSVISKYFLNLKHFEFYAYGGNSFITDKAIEDFCEKIKIFNQIANFKIGFSTGNITDQSIISVSQLISNYKNLTNLTLSFCSKNFDINGSSFSILGKSLVNLPIDILNLDLDWCKITHQNATEFNNYLKLIQKFSLKINYGANYHCFSNDSLTAVAKIFNNLQNLSKFYLFINPSSNANNCSYFELALKTLVNVSEFELINYKGVLNVTKQIISLNRLTRLKLVVHLGYDANVGEIFKNISSLSNLEELCYDVTTDYRSSNIKNVTEIFKNYFKKLKIFEINLNKTHEGLIIFCEGLKYLTSLNRLKLGIPDWEQGKDADNKDFSFFLVLANSLKAIPDLVHLDFYYHCIYRNNNNLDEKIKSFYQVVGEMSQIRLLKLKFWGLHLNEVQIEQIRDYLRYKLKNALISVENNY